MSYSNDTNSSPCIVADKYILAENPEKGSEYYYPIWKLGKITDISTITRLYNRETIKTYMFDDNVMISENSVFELKTGGNPEEENYEIQKEDLTERNFEYN
jgi:hypothetical protein